MRNRDTLSSNQSAPTIPILEGRQSRVVPSSTTGPVRDEPTLNFTPADVEKLLLSVAGMVARDRLARGVLLNHPEAVALLSTWVIERAREGARVADLMESGRLVLTRDQVMPGVAELLYDVQVEATFPDGRKLVTIHNPII
jgi:urease subunit gamma